MNSSQVSPPRPPARPSRAAASRRPPARRLREHRTAARPLPIRVRPAAGGTLNSYINRLARANNLRNLRPGLLRACLRDRTFSERSKPTASPRPTDEPSPRSHTRWPAAPPTHAGPASVQNRHRRPLSPAARPNCSPPSAPPPPARPGALSRSVTAPVAASSRKQSPRRRRRRTAPHARIARPGTGPWDGPRSEYQAMWSHRRSQRCPGTRLPGRGHHGSRIRSLGRPADASP